MVNAIGAVSSAQTSTLKADAQGSQAATPAPAVAAPDTSFVTSAIHVDNLQNVAILEYRSSETGEVIQQYPNQAQISAFKAAQRLAELAQENQHLAAASHHAASHEASTEPAASTGHPAAAPAPAEHVSSGTSGNNAAPPRSSGTVGGSAGKTSVIA